MNNYFGIISLSFGYLEMFNTAFLSIILVTLLYMQIQCSLLFTLGPTYGMKIQIRNPRLPRDRSRLRHAFPWVFSSKSYASFDFKKFAKIWTSVARSRDVLYSHVGTKFAQSPQLALCLCTKRMEMADFLKMHLNSVYSVFRAICQISYTKCILKLIKIKLQK